jgi:cysteine desulfurase/selenocysteine lyase
MNLIPHTYGRAHLGPGDEIVISAVEPHSNIVPWQMLCQETGGGAAYITGGASSRER